MTVNTTNITSGPYLGNDVVASFPYDFRIDVDTQLDVYETAPSGVQTLLILGTDYTVTGVGVEGGGTVTRVAGVLPVGSEWYIRSSYQPLQETTLSSQGGFLPSVHEGMSDRLTFLVQQLYDKVGRTISVSDGDGSGSKFVIPPLNVRANSGLGFNSVGDLEPVALVNLANAIPISQKGTSLGVATLDSNGDLAQFDKITTAIAAAIAVIVLDSDKVTHLASALDSYLIALDAQVQAVAIGQSAAVIGYSTRVLLDADLAHDAGTVAYVTNDPLVADNTTYIKIGATGIGVWERSNGSRVDTLRIEREAIVSNMTFTTSVYALALLDAVGRVGFSIDYDGNLTIGSSTVTPDQLTLLVQEALTLDSINYPTSGYLVAFVDASKRIGFGIKPDCTMQLGAETLTPAELTLLKAPLSTLTASEILCYGDSIVHGTGITVPWPNRLGALLPRTTENRGLNGRESSHLSAYAGAVTSLITLAGNTIPALASTPVTITAMDGTEFGTGSNVGAITFDGMLSGIPGTITVDTSIPTSPVRTFNRTNNGTSLVIAVQTPFFSYPLTTISGKTDDQCITIIAIGINNVITGNHARIVADIDAMVLRLVAVGANFIINGMYPPAYWGNTTVQYATINAINEELRAKYSFNYLDMHRTLIINATLPGDQASIDTDTVPTSLTYDGLHTNDLGAYIQAQANADFITLKGW